MRQTLTLAILAALISGAHAQDMTIGDRAPKLDVAKWVKGTPVKEFKAGRLYVVEFWATWCGPCRVSIPHITELAHKYKDKITFIGVSVWETKGGTEDTSYFANVTEFVEDMGEKMDYNVAIDGPQGKMAKTWMKAAGQDSIPTAFIVNGDGLIVWIGHPMSMDEVLGTVAEGNFDVKAAKEQFEREKALDAVYERLDEAFEAGGIEAVLKEIDKAIADTPVVKDVLFDMKFDVLSRTDPAKVVDFARELFRATRKMTRCS